MKNIFKEPGITRMTVAMAATLVLIVGTIFIGAEISNRKLEKQSFDEFQRDASFLNSVSVMMCLSGTWISGTFLSDYVNADVNDPDSVTINYFHRIKQDADVFKDVNTIYERMESFLNYNSVYSSSVFILEPSVTKNVPDGLAACCYPNDSSKYDFPELFRNEIYRRVSSSKYPVVLSGTLFPGDTPKVFFCTPILNAEDKVVAQFWVAYEINPFFSYVESFLSDDDDYDFVVTDSDGRIVFYPGGDFYGQKVLDLLPRISGKYPVDFCTKLVASLHNREMSFFESECQGKKIATYVFPIKFTDFHLVKTYKETTILRKVQVTINKVVLWSTVGIVLILAVLLFLFLRFYRQQKERNRVESELDIAEHIQRSILPVNGEIPLPSSLEVFGFQKSARVIGGDLYDYGMRNGKLCFCIGDVSGDGIPAALMMTQIYSLLNYVSKVESSPASILSVLNDSALDDDENRMICTMFAGVLDPATGELTFCNAGHCRPVIIRQGTAQELTMNANMPIYAFDTYPYTDQTVRLEPGDSLLLYTDGVTESRNSFREFFGVRRLLSALASIDDNSPSSVVDTVLKSLDTFCGSTEQNDDITMLCVKIKKYEPEI